MSKVVVGWAALGLIVGVSEPLTIAVTKLIRILKLSEASALSTDPSVDLSGRAGKGGDPG